MCRVAKQGGSVLRGIAIQGVLSVKSSQPSGGNTCLLMKLIFRVLFTGWFGEGQ